MKNKKGLTLVELLVSVAILNILIFVAVPSYEQYIIDSHEKAVENQMLDISTDFERIHARFFSYESAIDSKGNFIVSPELLRYPKELSESKRFDIIVENVSANSYTIIAKPTNFHGKSNGSIRLVFLDGNLDGHHDINNDGTWSEKWY